MAGVFFGTFFSTAYDYKLQEMAGPNDSLVALFKELMQLTIIDEGSPNAFRVRAYENAIQEIAAYRGDLKGLSERELTKIEGIGKSTASKIREFFETGTMKKVEELRKKYPPELVELSKIPGLGPKTLLRLKNELGIEKPRRSAGRDPRQAAPGDERSRRQDAREAPRRDRADGLDRQSEGGAPSPKHLPIARELVTELSRLAGGRARSVLREPSTSSGDGRGYRHRRRVGRTRRRWSRRSRTMRAVSEIIGSGETKVSVLTATGLQVDLRIVEPHQFGAAIQYFTGSKTHNIKLRQKALDRGWLLNEYGLSDAESGEVIASETEEAIYEALGMQMIPPPMREDRGEVELAAEGRLFAPVVREDLRGDLHVHTSLSGDGKSPLGDVVAAAEEQGYEYIAITDHAEDLAMNGVSRDQLREQRKDIEKLRKKHPNLMLLQGAELNIGPDGGLSTTTKRFGASSTGAWPVSTRTSTSTESDRRRAF